MDVLLQHGLGVTASVDEARLLVEAVLSHEIDSGEQITSWLAPRLYAVA